MDEEAAGVVVSVEEHSAALYDTDEHDVESHHHHHGDHAAVAHAVAVDDGNVGNGVSASDVADMTLEIEGDDMKSHMELLRNGAMDMDASNGHSASTGEGHHDGAQAALPPPETTASVAAMNPRTGRRTSNGAGGGGGRAANGASSGGPSSVSAVYRWYDIEDGFNLKRKEESSIAKCKLCRQQGKLERKACVRFSKSVTSNLWRHLKENHPEVYNKHAGEKKSVQMHHLVGAKKRGRKKKVTTATSEAPSSSSGATSMTELGEDGHVKLLDHHEDQDEGGHSDATSPLTNRKPSKKQKRNEQFFHEYQVLMSSTGNAHSHQQQALINRQALGSAATSAQQALVAGNFNPEKVREAMGYLCLYEMLPFDVCSSHAFRNLMLECSGGSGGYLDEANSFAIFGKEIAFGYAKKLAAEAKTRVAMQMKMVDFAHLMLSEWKPITSSATSSDASGLAMASTSQSSDANNGSSSKFLALFAVGLDQEFNAFRRCLHVLPIGSHHGATTLELVHDDDIKKALDRVVPCKYMPQVLAVDPPSHSYHTFCSANKLELLESVSSLLQHIMLSTIYEVRVTEHFSLGSSMLPAGIGFGDRRLDAGEFIESTTSSSAAEEFYEIPETELPTSILEELPANLTGHTLRDLIVKVMYLLAHLKQSRKSRKVMQKIALDEVGVTRDLYERVFVTALRDTPVSFGRIYHVLALVVEMMPTLKRYFSAHKNGLSDFSKLIQLASLSQYEWSRIAYLKTILKPFADATAKLDAERYVISSLVVPSIITLLEKLRDTRPIQIAVPEESSLGFSKKDGESNTVAGTVEEDLPEDIVALKDLAYANLSTSFGYLFVTPDASWSSQKRLAFNLLWSATLLDPRTRPFIIKGPLSQLEFWEVVKVEAANIAGTKMKDKESNNELAESAMSLDDENGQLDGTSAGKTGDLWDDLQANLTSCAQEEMLLSSSKSSLEMAKSTNLLEVEVSFFQEEGRISLRANPLEWWQSMRIKYPFLARLARYVLSMPFNVKIDDNPVIADNGLMKHAQSEMSLADLCDFLAASMNLRTEKNKLFEASDKPMWSTV
ncbi:Zinc finger bed domain-containing protein 1-like protein, partial [Globisporangium splendens]